MAGSHCSNTLMNNPFTKGIQFLLGSVLNRNAALFCQSNDFSHTAALDAFENVDAVDWAAFFQRFGDGVSAGNNRTFLICFLRCKFSGH